MTTARRRASFRGSSDSWETPLGSSLAVVRCGEEPPVLTTIESGSVTADRSSGLQSDFYLLRCSGYCSHHDFSPTANPQAARVIGPRCSPPGGWAYPAQSGPPATPADIVPIECRVVSILLPLFSSPGLSILVSRCGHPWAREALYASTADLDASTIREPRSRTDDSFKP